VESVQSSLGETRQPLIWVAQDPQLRDLCNRWLALPWLAVDTEFMRTDTFYPLPALIQINDGAANYLIDPLVLRDLSPLADLMRAPSVQKVLHACSEDLEVFHRLLGCLPENLLDTQIAAAFCGYGFSLGYASLVSAVMGVQIPKDETRSNWLQRPLTQAQQRYAALDVEYLYELTLVLKRQLAELGREDWVVDEGRQLRLAFIESQSSANASQRFKGAWRLDPRQLAVLMELAAWRDKTAQTENRVRGHIVRDKSLFAIAELLPSHISQLRKVPEMSEKIIRRYGEQIIEMIQLMQQLPEAELPQCLPRPPGTAQQNQINLMRERLAGVGQELKIAPEYLARRRDLEHIIRAQQNGLSGDDLFPESIAGWRAEIVKPCLRKIL
jgi:ribonuclease D